MNLGNYQVLHVEVQKSRIEISWSFNTKQVRLEENRSSEVLHKTKIKSYNLYSYNLFVDRRTRL